MPAVEAINRARTDPIGMPSDTGLLLETMQLEEPRKPQVVPNHLLETKIYSKVSQNAMVKATPSVIHFGGFEVDKKHTMELTIVNASTEVIRMHIIPPQTKYFYIKYQKTERLVPGLTIDCVVEFTPDEWRYYYDCIRINCPGEENLVIPIHAYPVMSTREFPQLFNFPPVPVGHRLEKVFPLRCDAPVDFEYQLTYLQPHPAFSVDPMSGIIPANGVTEISVTFAPIEFHTAYMRVQLVISQFNSNPIVCTFTGTSPPGLLKEISDHLYEPDEEYLLDPRSLTPLGRARRKKKKAVPMEPVNVKREVEYEGYKFPAQLDNPYAVSQVLNQEAGKLRAKDLREAVVTKESKPKVATRQMKEAKFEHQVRQNVYEERQNQLRWQVKLGEEQITTEERSSILTARNDAWNEYMYKRRGDPIPEDEYNRTCTACTFKRTLRDSKQLASEGTKFDMYTNDMWAVRHDALHKFAQAARKVIIRLRADFKLKSLKKLVEDWHKKKFASDVTELGEIETDEQKEKIEGDEKFELLPNDLILSADKIKLHQFPTYVPPNVKDDMAPDALGNVPFKPTEVVVKRKVPYFSLKVPLQYKLQNYRPHSVHGAASGYEPIKLPKPLRTGAEDEVISLPPPVMAKEKTKIITRASLALDRMQEGDITVTDLEEPKQKAPQPQPAALLPPQALFQPIEYPSLHIFNPAPGLQVFQSPMPYAETDPEFHLCPLPRYLRKDHATNPHAATQRKYMDREDVVRGIMAWKKFPSQGLTSLSNTPTLTNVWVPRWDDQFGSELLPEDVPPLFDSLPDDDRENIIEEEEDEEGRATSRAEPVSLTPEMVNAQFSLIDSSVPTEEKVPADAFPHGNRMPATNIPVSGHGPVPREKREEELEYFITKKYNRLGAKVQARVNTMNNMSTDPNLVLK